MSFFFKNEGPFDINYIIKKSVFSQKKKLKKKNIKNVSNLLESSNECITFFDNIKYLDYLKKTNASHCFIKSKYALFLNKKTVPIISSEPLLDFIVISKLFYPESTKDNYKLIKNLKFKNSFIDKSVKIKENFDVGTNTVIKKNVKIGKNVTIGSNCVISNSIIGNNVTINDGTIIGKIGYGFKFINNKLTFIPHIGHVNILDNVYIGSNCSIDRGSFSNTIIGNNTMIDNLVHIAHNVKIGSYCFIAGQVGIAGSTTIGNNCMIGGQAGISGHLTIGNNVYIGGNSGVIKDVDSNKKIMGYPAVEFKKFLKKGLK